MEQNKISFRSQKGAAIVLVAVMVTGIIMLVSVIAIENLRRSTQLQGTQKKSLDSLYKAEEGAEYGLYVNKEKNSNNNFDRPFKISIWEKFNNVPVIKNDNQQVMEQLTQPTEGKDIVITSQNIDNANANQNSAPQRTVFTNLPGKYQTQVPLWSIREGCEEGNCDVDYKGNPSKTYRVVLATSVFERDSWNDVNWEYRLVFKCGEKRYWENPLTQTGGVNGCTITNLKLAYVCEDVPGCDFTGCTAKDYDPNPIKFPDGNSGKIITTNWFHFIEENGSRFNLTDKKLIMEFTLEGTAEVVTFKTELAGLTMCEGTGSSWVSSKSKRVGLASLEIRKAKQTP